jgi:nicotinate-nucleotide adenylyltransferase
VRLAILGGTFDPIHNGHLRAAETVGKAFDIDEVHFIPAFTPPHKSRSDITSVFHRFAMVALATTGFERFRVSTLEVDRLESRYSVDTLELMHSTYPGSSFFFITGTDMYCQIEEWKDYRRLFQLTSFAIVNRPGFAMRTDLGEFKVIDRGSTAEISDKLGVYYLPYLQEDVSSTQIREEARKGRDIGAWIPTEVESYIARNAIYQ